MNAVVTSIPAAGRQSRVRIADILLAPRYAVPRSSQWFVGVLFATCSITALVLGVVFPGPKATAAVLGIYAFGAAFLWWLWLGNLLLIARDARYLRLAGVVRNTTTAAWLYAFATVAAPAVVTWLGGRDVVLAIETSALAVAASLAWMLLPRWFAMWFGFLPAIFIGLRNAALVPPLLDPRYRTWGWLALAVLAAVAMIRWRQLLRNEDNDDSRWRSALILQMRRHATTRDWWSIDRNWAWRRSRSRTIDVDFSGVGPAQPVKAIGVALGGWYVPQTLRSRLATAVRVVLPLLLFIALMLLMNAGHTWSLHKVWLLAGLSGGLWVGLFGSTMLAIAIPGFIQRRWRSRADTALLALLPGLGGGQALRHLARAAFSLPMLLFAVLWLCLLATSALLRQPATAMLLASLFEFAAAALMAMTVCNVWAGRSMRLLVKIILGVVLIVLADASFVVSMSGPADSAWTWRFEGVLVLGWLALIAWAVWRTVHAWRALQRRPHPFMANG